MSSRRPLSKAEKILFFVCPLAILPLAAIVFVSGGRDAEPNWNIAPAAKRPIPNGYDFYVAAAKATVRFKPEVDAASDTTFSPPGSAYALKNYSLARRQQWLAANAKTWALLHQGLNTPLMAPPYSLRGRTSWGKLRQLARDITARSHIFQMARQPMKATMSVLDGMQVGQDTTRGGELIARLVDGSIAALSHEPLDDWNKTINQLGAGEAKTAAQRLEKMLANRPTAKDVLTATKRAEQLDVQAVFGDANWRGSWQPGANGLAFTENESPAHAWQRQTVAKQTILDNVNRIADANIAAAALPYSQATQQKPPSDLDPFSPVFAGTQNRFFQNETRTATSNNMLLLRLAVRAYIAEHKTAPPTLAALVPGILKTIPTDVYNDGKPLFYKPNGKIYKLWSVGPDGINNGGVSMKDRQSPPLRRPASNLLDNKGDFVAGLNR